VYQSNRNCKNRAQHRAAAKWERKKVKWLYLIVLFAAAFAAFAQQPDLPVSKKYPLQAHIVSVETEEHQQDLINGSGKTSEVHLVKAEIDGKTYRLTIKLPMRDVRPFQHRTWLQPGTYPARRTTHGFEFEYKDGDKVRHEELRIATEE
jgi:hypothetical protein